MHLESSLMRGKVMSPFLLRNIHLIWLRVNAQVVGDFLQAAVRTADTCGTVAVVL
jgi:hypothetical protein